MRTPNFWVSGLVATVFASVSKGRPRDDRVGSDTPLKRGVFVRTPIGILWVCSRRRVRSDVEADFVWLLWLLGGCRDLFVHLVRCRLVENQTNANCSAFLGLRAPATGAAFRPFGVSSIPSRSTVIQQ